MKGNHNMEITQTDVIQFVENINEPRKTDIKQLIELFTKVTQKNPKLWGTIIGFGDLHYTYKTGHEGNMPLLGLANRKNAITLYVSYTLDTYEELQSLGKYSIGKSCLYIKKLKYINIDVLEIILVKAIKETLSLDFIIDNET